MSKYKVLLWDLDGTILDFLAAEKEAIRTCFSIFDMGICTDEMLANYSAINVKYWEALERGEMTKPQILVGRFREFFEKEGLDVSKADAFNEEYQIRLGDTVVFHDNADLLLPDLKQDYILALVTNGTRLAQRNKLKKSGLDQVFDYFFISDEVGIEKPNKELFDIIFAELGIGSTISKDEVLIIGDSLTSDMRGGNNAGIPTCWYNPSNNANATEVRVDYEIDNLNQLKNCLQD